MNGKLAVILLSGLLFACAPAQPPQPAAPPAPPPTPAAAPAPTAAGEHYVNILGARCDALLALSPDDRVQASMFYIGYMARRYRVRSANVGLIPSMVGRATDYCSANPNRTVASVFADVYRDTRRQ